MILRWLIVLFVVLIGAPVAPAAAGELRIMTHDDVTSASDCIGRPASPLCAAETVAACAIGNRRDLCDAVEYEDKVLEWWRPSDYARLYYYRYEFHRSKPLRGEDIPEWARRRAENRGGREMSLYSSGGRAVAPMTSA